MVVAVVLPIVAILLKKTNLLSSSAAVSRGVLLSRSESRVSSSKQTHR